VKKHLLIAAGIILVVMFVSTGCINSAADPKNVQPSRINDVTFYGNNVYYFDCIQASFGNSLSTFISQHPELEIVSIASDNTGGYGITMGYFVVFKNHST